MKNHVLYGLLLACAVACGSAITAKEVEIQAPSVQCAFCEKTIEEAVKNVDGVQSVSVDLSNKVVLVTYAEGQTDVAKIETAITQVGYQANHSKADPTAYKSLPDCCKMEAKAH